jgi:predicted ester cyclase
MPGVPGTREGFRQVVLATRQALPDVHVEIEQMVSEGDIVVFHDHAAATSQGEFMNISPTGKRLQWTEMHMLRVRGDQIVEHWANFDQLSMLQQLGAIRPN